MTIIDLTHPISETMPHWPGDPKTTITKVADICTDGYSLNNLSIGEHSGTHIGSPLHFSNQGLSVDKIPVENLVVPGIKISVKDQVQQDHDYLLQETDIAHLTIPERSLILVETSWSSKWSTDDYIKSENMHFPGVSEKATKFLIKQNIVGIGIDSPGIDGGLSTNYASNTLLAENGLYHLENLTNLDKLSAEHFTVFVGALPLKNGSGSPCRVLATF